MKKTILIFVIVLGFNLHLRGQSMPMLFGNPPIEYIGSEYASITLKTTPETIEKLVPDPLVPDTRNTLIVSIIHQKVPAIMDYHEMYISIPTSYNKKSGNYYPLLYLDETAPIVAGRESVGFPKVDADFIYKKEQNKISATLKRNGKVLLEFSANLSTPNSDVNETDKAYGFVVKEIPSADGSSTPALLRLNSYTVKDLKTYEFRNCKDINFKLFASKDNFMPHIPVIDVIKATVYKADFILDYGSIEYDYLKN